MPTKFQALLPLIVAHALSLIEAIVILLVGLWLSGAISAFVRRALARMPHIDLMLQGFFASLTRYAVLTVTVLAVLSQCGIQTTSLIAVLGAASLAVGLALQGTLSNLAAGVMLLIFRPFHIGQKVMLGGVTGTVKELSLFWTEVITEDQVQVILPNAGVWGTPLRNYSVYPAPAAAGEARFRVADESKLETVLAKVRSIVAAQPDILQDATTILLDRTVADNALEIVVAFKTSGDAPTVRSHLILAVHDAIAPSPQPGDGAVTPAVPPQR